MKVELLTGTVEASRTTLEYLKDRFFLLHAYANKEGYATTAETCVR